MTEDEIFHLAMPDDWAAAKPVSEYRISTRGKTLDEVGFVHCSFALQLEGVANRFYADVAELVLLQIEPELLEAEVRVESTTPGSDEKFPHVYGPIPTSAVISTTWWDRGDDGIWRKPVSI